MRKVLWLWLYSLLKLDGVALVELSFVLRTL
jgi:hypothetical protein